MYVRGRGLRRPFGGEFSHIAPGEPHEPVKERYRGATVQLPLDLVLAFPAPRQPAPGGSGFENLARAYRS